VSQAKPEDQKDVYGRNDFLLHGALSATMLRRDLLRELREIETLSARLQDDEGE